MHQGAATWLAAETSAGVPNEAVVTASMSWKSVWLILYGNMNSSSFLWLVFKSFSNSPVYHLRSLRCLCVSSAAEITSCFDVEDWCVGDFKLRAISKPVWCHAARCYFPWRIFIFSIFWRLSGLIFCLISCRSNLSQRILVCYSQNVNTSRIVLLTEVINSRAS